MRVDGTPMPALEAATRDQVVVAVRAWIGTPYHHQASLRGVGTDCLGLVRGVYRALYEREAEQAPAYSPDWAEALGQETLLEAARRNLVEVSPLHVRMGDVVVFRMRRGAIAKHAAIMTSASTMVHAVEAAGTVEVVFAPWWRRKLAGVFSFPGIKS